MFRFFGDVVKLRTADECSFGTVLTVDISTGICTFLNNDCIVSVEFDSGICSDESLILTSRGLYRVLKSGVIEVGDTVNLYRIASSFSAEVCGVGFFNMQKKQYLNSNDLDPTTQPALLVEVKHGDNIDTIAIIETNYSHFMNSYSYSDGKFAPVKMSNFTNDYKFTVQQLISEHSIEVF